MAVIAKETEPAPKSTACSTALLDGSVARSSPRSTDVGTCVDCSWASVVLPFKGCGPDEVEASNEHERESEQASILDEKPEACNRQACKFSEINSQSFR